MSFYQMWIGDLDDPDFIWDIPEDKDGRLPRALSPKLPGGRHSQYFSDFKDWCKESKIERRAMDWGSSVARVAKAQILDFYNYRYFKYEEYTNPEKFIRDMNGNPGYVDWVNNLVELVNNLDDNRKYALVAIES